MTGGRRRCSRSGRDVSSRDSSEDLDGLTGPARPVSRVDGDGRAHLGVALDATVAVDMHGFSSHVLSFQCVFQSRVVRAGCRRSSSIRRTPLSHSSLKLYPCSFIHVRTLHGFGRPIRVSPFTRSVITMSSGARWSTSGRRLGRSDDPRACRCTFEELRQCRDGVGMQSGVRLVDDDDRGTERLRLKQQSPSRVGANTIAYSLPVSFVFLVGNYIQ